jgi:hypothetical protein
MDEDQNITNQTANNSGQNDLDTDNIQQIM